MLFKREGKFAPNQCTNPKFLPINFYLRPHHFVDNIYVRSVLRGELDPLNAAYENYQLMVDSLARLGNLGGYYSDVFGTSGTQQETHLGLLKVFFNRLAILPSRANIALSITPDGICASCSIGKHCRGTNYSSIFKPLDTVAAESRCLEKLSSALSSSGFQNEVDFTTRVTNHTMYNFMGLPLSSSSLGIPTQATFEEIVVRAGALRQTRLPNEASKYS